MSAPQTLHNFSLLPPELRNIIWELSLPPPRVYDIYPASSSQKIPAEQGLRFANPQTEPPPALAAVCRESRSFVLHYYQPLTLGGGGGTTGTTKYVDLSRDVLLLESCLFERNLLRAMLFLGKIPLVRDNLRSLALGTSYGVHTGVWHPVLGWRRKRLTRNNMGRFLQRLSALGALEKLVFVVHQEVQFEVEALPASAGIKCGVWNEGRNEGYGEIMGNATLYQKGTEPPRPRSSLIGNGEAEAGVAHEGASSRASTPGSATSESSCASSSSSTSEGELFGAVGGSFCRVPWTDDKPWQPHVNEIFYYPLREASDADSEDDQNNKKPGLDPKGPYARGPIPTSDEWLRFRRAFRRDLEAGLALGLAEDMSTHTNTKTPLTKSGTTGDLRSERKRKSGQLEGEDSTWGPTRSKKLQKSESGAEMGRPEERYSMPAIEGASVLWRYSQSGVL